MELTGLHLLLTYTCTYECDHCFVWGSARQTGVMKIEQIQAILKQAREMESIKWVYFEGGEPFLYYPVLLRGVQMATAMGFHVGIVSNAYWATSSEDALVWLKPFADLIEDLTISVDEFHGNNGNDATLHYVENAARELVLRMNTIVVAQPETVNLSRSLGRLPVGKSNLIYRGRAACKLVDRADQFPWQLFTFCPNEVLENPSRVHVDPFGNVHICQGVIIGNVFERPLRQIIDEFHVGLHPICGPLAKGGPVELVKKYGLEHKQQYADACHLCYESRRALRSSFPAVLGPGQMYGEV